ncbi:MAG: AI-2E family transporter, partial [Terriglobales bacterium]
MFKWLTTILLLLFVYHVREIFPPFIVGAIFAYLLHPLVKLVKERLGWPPALAVACIYISSLVLIGYLAWHAWPELSSQALNLYQGR